MLLTYLTSFAYLPVAFKLLVFIRYCAKFQSLLTRYLLNAYFMKKTMGIPNIQVGIDKKNQTQKTLRKNQ